MGASTSKESVTVVEAARQLGPEVTQRCKARFAELAAGQPTVSVRSLVASLGILGSVPAIQQLWLFTAVDHTVRGSQAGDPRAGPAVVDLVTQSSFLLFMSKVSSVDKDARRSLFFGTIFQRGAAEADAVALEALLAAALGDDLGADPTLLEYMKWEALKQAGKRGSLGELQSGLTESQFSSFLDRCSLAEGLLNELFFPLDGFGGLVTAPYTLERVRGTPRFMGETSLLLPPTAQTMLEWSLPRAKHGEWALLFSSRRDGASFQRMRSCIEGKGSTLIIIRDGDGHVFGAFANSSWQPQPEFYGEDANFLFSIAPTQRIFRPTGVNANYQYFNSMQDTMPNGLALGGQFDYFGLWISGEFDTGHSKGHPLSSTFANPQLSAQQDFKVDDVEMWRVGPEEKDEDEFLNDESSDDEDSGAGPKAGKSILDKAAKADKALLELAGIKMHSEDIRAPEVEEKVEYRADGKVKRPVY